MMEFFNGLMSADALSALAQVIMIDLVLAGDNAVVIGLAVAGLPKDQRNRAILIGIAAATVLRIIFAGLTTHLLSIIGLLLAGGILLLWVCWKMWRELRDQAEQEEAVAGAVMDDDPTTEPSPEAIAKQPKTFRSAFLQIFIADLSMSLDNVLAVAGAARQHPAIMVFGLLMSIALMGVAASFIARLLHRYRWIGYNGLAIVLYVALHMMWEGHQDIVRDLGKTDAYNAVMPDFMDIQPKAPAPAH